MYHPLGPPRRSSPDSEAVLLLGYRTQADVGPFLPFMLPDQQAPSTSPAYATSQSGFPNSNADAQFHLSGPTIAVEGSSLLVSTSPTSPPSTSYPMRNNALFGFGNPLVISHVSRPSGSSVHGTQQAAGDSVAVVSDHFMPLHEGAFPSTMVPATTGGQAIPTGSHAEHIVSWFLMCWDAVIVNGPRKFIPQAIYQPRSQGDKERYVSHAQLNPPIIFLTHDSLEWGVPVSHLLSKQSTRLVGGEEPAFSSCGPSIGIRVQWPGYQPCHKQVQTRDYTFERRMINKAKLAKVVAKCVKQFMDMMSEQTMEVGSDRQWRVGPLDIKVDDITFVSLHHVSQGSWQPQLRLRRTVGTNVTGTAWPGRRRGF